MTDHDYEDLSRLLSGDLGPAEADALRARIDVDPDLQAAWALMTALPGALSELAPPEAVPVAWVEQTLRLSEPRWRWGHPAWWLAAAALLSHVAPWPVPATVESLTDAAPAMVDCRPIPAAPPAPAPLFGDPADARPQLAAQTPGVLPPETRRRPSGIQTDAPLETIQKTAGLRVYFDG